MRRLKRRVEDIRGGGPSLFDAPGRASARLKRLGARARALAPAETVKRSVEATLKAATAPRAVETVRTGLTTLGNASMAIIFRGEPDAQRLFELADWCGERSGRGAIMAILLQDALSPQGAFFQIAGPLVQFGPNGQSVQIQWASVGTQWPQMRDALDRAQHGALRTLSAMVAAATETEPPEEDADAERLASFIQRADIPERFKSLPDKVLGRAASPSKHDCEPHDGHKPAARAPQPGDTSKNATGLAPWRSAMPTLSLSPGHRFVLGPYLLFLQTMMTRNMVDALPTMAEKIRDELTSDLHAPDAAVGAPPDIVVTKGDES